jgi:hypothetical protein
VGANVAAVRKAFEAAGIEFRGLSIKLRTATAIRRAMQNPPLFLERGPPATHSSPVAAVAGFDNSVRTGRGGRSWTKGETRRGVRVALPEAVGDITAGSSRAPHRSEAAFAFLGVGALAGLR